jgi:hypothetical protein
MGPIPPPVSMVVASEGVADVLLAHVYLFSMVIQWVDPSLPRADYRIILAALQAVLSPLPPVSGVSCVFGCGTAFTSSGVLTNVAHLIREGAPSDTLKNNLCFRVKPS